MIIMDIEASGLAKESYPIEIAWQHRYNPKCCDSFLIQPACEWTYWDEFAEREIHHIHRSDLSAFGIEVGKAAIRLNTQLSGQHVYSDAPTYDRQWLRKLFVSAGIDMEFKVMSVFGLIHPAKVQQYHHHYDRTPTTHRAKDDVEHIISSLNFTAP